MVEKQKYLTLKSKGMKKSLFMMLIVLNMTSYAQTIKRDSQGNYYQIDKSVIKQQPVIATGKTFTDKNGFVYPVYKTKTGKLFIFKVSKTTGNKYRYYLN